MLRIAKTKDLATAKHTVLGWRVGDVTAKVKELVGRGVTFETFEGLPQDELGIWESPSGDQVAWFKDPDGNRLSLTEFPADPLTELPSDPLDTRPFAERPPDWPSGGRE